MMRRSGGYPIPNQWLEVLPRKLMKMKARSANESSGLQALLQAVVLSPMRHEGMTAVVLEMTRKNPLGLPGRSNVAKWDSPLFHRFFHP